MASLPSVLLPFQTSCNRSPFELALAEAYAREDTSITLWRSQTIEFLDEMTGPHFTDMTEGQFRHAMHGIDRILSLGLLFVTLQNRLGVSSYIDALKTCGIPGLSEASSKLLKAVTSLPTSGAVMELMDRGLSEAADCEHLLRQCLRAHDTLSAMAFLITTRRQRIRWRDQIALAKWLLTHTPSGKVIGRQPDSYFGAHPPEAERLIALVVPQEIGLLDHMPLLGAAPACMPDVTASPDLSGFRITNAMFIEATGKFHRLRARLPANLKNLLPREWLECLEVTDCKRPSVASPASDFCQLRR